MTGPLSARVPLGAFGTLEGPKGKVGDSVVLGQGREGTARCGALEVLVAQWVGQFLGGMVDLKHSVVGPLLSPWRACDNASCSVFRLCATSST
jgi:hypothetical protein